MNVSSSISESEAMIAELAGDGCKLRVDAIRVGHSGCKGCRLDIDKAERLIAEAAAQGSQLVVFPEAFIGWYVRGNGFGVVIVIRSLKREENFRKYHASAIDVPDPEVSRLAALAGQYKVYLVIRGGGTLYCSVFFFDFVGEYLGKHRKLIRSGSSKAPYV